MRLAPVEDQAKESRSRRFSVRKQPAYGLGRSGRESLPWGRFFLRPNRKSLFEFLRGPLGIGAVSELGYLPTSLNLPEGSKVNSS